MRFRQALGVGSRRLLITIQSVVLLVCRKWSAILKRCPMPLWPSYLPRARQAGLLIPALLLTYCGIPEGPAVDPPDLRLVLVDSLLIDGARSGLGITSVRQFQDSTYVFVDQFAQSLTMFDRESDTLRQIGMQGEGPGEYGRPMFLRTIGDSAIAFTDLTNPHVKMLSRSGRQWHRVSHTNGGARPFDMFGDTLLIQRLTGHRLTVHDFNGEELNRLFPISTDLPILSRVPGGGVVILDGRAYTMNGVETRVFVYDLQTGETATIDPPAWQRYPANKDYEVLSSITMGEWNRAGDRFAAIVHFDGLYRDEAGTAYLLAVLMHGEQWILQILSLRGELLLERSEPDEWYVGNSGNRVHTISFLPSDSEEDDVLIRTYRLQAF